MADEVIDAPEGAAEQVSAPDLRETIVAAVAKQREEPAEPEVVAADMPETDAEKAARVVDGKGRAHDEKGRFAPKDAAPEAEAAKPEAAAAPVDSKEAPAVDAAPSLRPPTSWSPTAKVEFDKLPADHPIVLAVAKREEEVNNGFAKFQEYKPVERFMEMAKQSGTTLDKALENYVGIENRLRQDFPSGITELCQRQGIHPVALANAILARHGASPQQDGTGDTTANQTAPSGDPAVLQKLTALEQRLQQQEAQREREINTQVQTELQRFASDPKHKFYENVKADMGFLINSGKAEDLQSAYDMACRMNPEIHGLLIKQEATPSAKPADAVQRAKAADKAIGGAPSAGFVPTSPVKPGASIRDTIRAAVEAQRGV
jgi:hypothetical protein